jgi:hypothetical protein
MISILTFFHATDVELRQLNKNFLLNYSGETSLEWFRGCGVAGCKRLLGYFEELVVALD